MNKCFHELSLEFVWFNVQYSFTDIIPLVKLYHQHCKEGYVYGAPGNVYVMPPIADLLPVIPHMVDMNTGELFLYDLLVNIICAFVIPVWYVLHLLAELKKVFLS